MAGTWDEENWFDLADYSNLDMDACIRAMEENGISSSSSSTGSPVAEISKIDRMDEDTSPPSMALSEEPLVPTSSERLNASTSSIHPTGNTGDRSPTMQSESPCTLDIVMGDQYSPTAPTYSGGQPTSGKGINEVITDRRPSGHGETLHTIGNPPDQAESTTKPTRGGNLRPLSVVEAPCRSSGRLSISYDGSSSGDCCWRHEVNAIGNTV